MPDNLVGWGTRVDLRYAPGNSDDDAAAEVCLCRLCFFFHFFFLAETVVALEVDLCITCNAIK